MQNDERTKLTKKYVHNQEKVKTIPLRIEESLWKWLRHHAIEIGSSINRIHTTLLKKYQEENQHKKHE